MLGRSAAALRRKRGGRVDEGSGAHVLRDEFGMLAEAKAGALDLHDDGVVEQAIEQRGGDDGITEHCGMPRLRSG